MLGSGEIWLDGLESLGAGSFALTTAPRASSPPTAVMTLCFSIQPSAPVIPAASLTIRRFCNALP
jgi:hypothetical protein